MMDMYRKTTVINEKDFLKDMPSLNELRNIENGFEQYCDLPDEIGNGFMYLIKLRPGLILGIGDYQYLEDIEIHFEFDTHYFVLGFQIPANISFTSIAVQGKKDFFVSDSGQSLIFYVPKWQGIAKYQCRIPLRTVGIYIDPLLLNSFIDGRQDQIPAIINDIINGDNEKHYYQPLTSTPMITTAINEILNCPYQGPLRRLYFESKALELITHSLANLGCNKNRCNIYPALKPVDIERIHEAKNVLIRNPGDPPSLLELAKQAGINKNKLNYNFRQVFGTSVFDYLRINRLERARELLKSKEKNVSEVAFEVGYAQHSNFTRAFKKYFGTNPADYLF